MKPPLFEGKSLLIATRHHKEKVLGPLFEGLGFRLLPIPPIDTDRLGTFSGEVERPGDMLETAEMKAALGLAAQDADYVLVSEGSFGPHPAIPFVAADLELLYLAEAETGRFWRSDYLSTDTNFNARRLESMAALRDFAREAGFPEHALILRAGQHDHSHQSKGLQSQAALEEAARALFATHGSLWAETDMRAHLNPTRMQVLAKAGQKMVEMLRQACPHCQAPGFTVTETVAGLPCDWCRRPTRLPLYQLQRCGFCGHEERQYHPQGEAADPGQCGFCNP